MVDNSSFNSSFIWCPCVKAEQEQDPFTNEEKSAIEAICDREEFICGNGVDLHWDNNMIEQSYAIA